MASELITAGELRRGDTIIQFPYGGSEKLPVIVQDVMDARKKGYVVIVGFDATGACVQCSAGHRTQMIRVRRAVTR